MAWTSLLALWAFASMAQAQSSACLNELVPCLQYINSKKTPSSSCRDPLKSLIRSNPECLRSMLGSSTTKTGWGQHDAGAAIAKEARREGDCFYVLKPCKDEEQWNKLWRRVCDSKWAGSMLANPCGSDCVDVNCITP